jgi:hypothetical protein
VDKAGQKYPTVHAPDMVVSAAVAQNDPAGHATGAVRLRIGQNAPAAHVVHMP